MELSQFNNDNYVAHYTTLDTAVRHILPNYQIRISSVETLNDPYENVSDWINSEASSTDEMALQSSRYLSRIRQNSMKHIKVFSTTGVDSKKNNVDISNHIYCRPRMWSQYGDNHKGVCLIFDKEELNESFRYLNPIGIKSKEVQYLSNLEKTINHIFIAPLEHQSILKDPRELYKVINSNYIMDNRFFRKHIDWKDENEFRWLLFMEETNDVYAYCEKALKAIVFGCDVPQSYYSSLKYYAIPTYSLIFINGKYEARKEN